MGRVTDAAHQHGRDPRGPNGSILPQLLMLLHSKRWADIDRFSTFEPSRLRAREVFNVHLAHPVDSSAHKETQLHA